jgi:SecD/SecF fusion protein
MLFFFVFYSFFIFKEVLIMKSNRLLTLVLVVLLLLAFSGAGLWYAFNNLNLGLDLRGGVYVLLQAKDSSDVDGDAIERAMTIMRNRIDELGVAEPVLQREGNDRIRIELPGVEDQRKAKEIIGRTAMLTFVGPNGEELLTGADLSDARAVYDSRNMPVVSLEFNTEGTTKFADATSKYYGQVISIYLDEELVSAPVVNAVISDGRAQIEGSMTAQDASNVALMLRSGSLPVELVELETRTVGPTLGQDSMTRSIRAGLAGLVLVLLFMIIVYKMLGVAASISLVVYTTLVFGVLNAINATLTLPGIAGLILSVGMAVDANVIIFERIKEEMATGRTTRTAINAGFERAFRAIIDANVTTLIAAAVLFHFGTGAIRGFAVTLSVGILVSMFTSIILTRFLLRRSVAAGLFKSAENVAERKFTAFDFVSKRKMAFIISGLLILAGLFSMSTTGLNQGIDFTGGTIMHLDIAQQFSLDDARDVMAPLELQGSQLQKVGIEGLGEGETHELLIKTVSLSPAQQDAVFEAFQERYDLEEDALLRVESVGSIVGGELQRQAFMALIIASLLMVLYITIRFEYRFALAAIAALLHDAMIVLAFFSIFRLEINSPFIAAILTILGYSINDTIVIFDRARENLKNRRKETLPQVINNTINQTLRRSLYTSGTTLLVLITLFAFGGVTLRPFISALMVGVITGTYSSIYVASPLWLTMKDAESRNKMKTKAA